MDPYKLSKSIMRRNKNSMSRVYLYIMWVIIHLVAYTYNMAYIDPKTHSIRFPAYIKESRLRQPFSFQLSNQLE